MSTSTPPPVGPRGLRIRVALQGAQAYRDGATVLACPYDADARPVSARAWVGGYMAAAKADGVTMPGTDTPADGES